MSARGDKLIKISPLRIGNRRFARANCSFSISRETRRVSLVSSPRERSRRRVQETKDQGVLSLSSDASEARQSREKLRATDFYGRKTRDRAYREGERNRRWRVRARSCSREIYPKAAPARIPRRVATRWIARGPLRAYAHRANVHVETRRVKSILLPCAR